MITCLICAIASEPQYPQAKRWNRHRINCSTTLPEKFKAFSGQGFVKPNISDMYKELKGTKESRVLSLAFRGLISANSIRERRKLESLRYVEVSRLKAGLITFIRT